MNAVIHTMPRATRMASTYQAWRMCPGKAYPLGLYGTLDEAVTEAAPKCQHKDQLAVLETGIAGKVLHCWQIVQGKETWRHNPVTRAAERFKPLKANLLFAWAVDHFTPTAAFVALPGADVVGRRAEVEVGR